MKYFVRQVSLLLLLTATVKGQDKPVKNLDIYLLIGQSNMAGVAEVSTLQRDTLSKVFLFNDKNQWEKAVCTQEEGFNRYSTVKKSYPQKLGPGYGFAQKLTAYVKQDIGVVVNAKGGTSIVWWQKGYEGPNDYNLYEQAIARAKAALAATPGSTIKAIIWHQGESDNSSPKNELYMSRLKKLVADLRTDLGNDKLPFIAGEVGTWNGRGKGVNPVIRQIQDSIPYSTWVSSSGLTSIDVKKNNPHFDTYSQLVLGGRYADKVLQIIYKLSPGDVTLYTGEDYTGRSVILKPGTYNSTDLERFGIGKQEIRSIDINKGAQVLCYPDNLNDKPAKYTKSINRLTNPVSSITIR
ncbi:sialate O-acetylesterase (plasmid) [Pedobacter sp. BS3]|uniref:sialate O-acetylesterase n=1 Tax=Pedobacter sp. BS3 TaxID=2567937 RepID=UPI0011ECC91E|nr:sialate O-acetylesterase [Pedobacter sp. BS3]TZF86272.1 sialate O-acetylesterase [Pedobacter sp. BS3]